MLGPELDWEVGKGGREGNVRRTVPHETQHHRSTQATAGLKEVLQEMHLMLGRPHHQELETGHVS